MSDTQTKLLSAVPATTTVGTGEYLAKVDANGQVTQISLADLRTAVLDGLPPIEAAIDNVFIVMCRQYYPLPQLVSAKNYASLVSATNIACGILVIEGGRSLVVSLREAACPWSSAAMVGGATSTQVRVTAMADFNGKENTAAILAHSTSSAINNTSAYAPGYCNLYSSPASDGKGYTAGKWWLPSLGELMMIRSNKQKINYCLSVISGADPLSDKDYWSSTEKDPNSAWTVGLGDSGAVICDWYNKKQINHCIRPVTALNDIT